MLYRFLVKRYQFTRPLKKSLLPCKLCKVPSSRVGFPPVWEGFPYVFLYFFPSKSQNFPARSFPFCLFFPGLPIYSISLYTQKLTLHSSNAKTILLVCTWAIEPWFRGVSNLVKFVHHPLKSQDMVPLFLRITPEDRVWASHPVV